MSLNINLNRFKKNPLLKVTNMLQKKTNVPIILRD